MKKSIKSRLKGLLITIGAAVLIIADIVVSSLIHHNNTINGVRAGEVLGILVLLLVLGLVWLIYGLLLFVFGQKAEKNKNADKTSSPQPSGNDASVTQDDSQDENTDEKTNEKDDK